MAMTLPNNYERNRLIDYYVDWCEDNDLDPSDDHWDEFYEATDNREW